MSLAEVLRNFYACYSGYMRREESTQTSRNRSLWIWILQNNLVQTRIHCWLSCITHTQQDCTVSTCSPPQKTHTQTQSGFTSFPPNPRLLLLLFTWVGLHFANTLLASRGEKGKQHFNYFFNNGHGPVIHFECLSKALLVFVFLDLTSHHLTHAYRIEIAPRSRRQRAGCGFN